MKITVGQFNIKSKNIKYNFEQMSRLITEAIDNDYELIVFGEYSLSGYDCGQLFLQKSFYDELQYYTNMLTPLSHKIKIIFGTVINENNNNYVVAATMSNSEITYSYKTNLNKRELNEVEYFTSGENNTSEVIFRSDYAGEENVIVLDSSSVNNTLSIQQNIVYANTVGISHSNKHVFINGGNSFVNIDNETYAFENNFSNGLIKERNLVKSARKLEALVYGIQQYSLNNFGENKKWIVGNSGGLDSAVTISLLTIALGSENVISYNLRSKFNSDKTVNNAKKLADALNVKHYSEYIDDAVDGYIKTLNSFNYMDIPTLAYENIQARTRGHLLGGFSSLENAAICNNGNKLEIMLGYATLYGDTIGALSVIGDLVKTEVFELAHEINEYCEKEVVQLNLLPVVQDYNITFETPPSAELKSDQVDPMKWFYHDNLVSLLMKYSREEILSMYLNNQFEGLEIGKWLKHYQLNVGQDFIDDFNWFIRTFEINNFKRMQMAPVLVFGNEVINVDFKDSTLQSSKSVEVLNLERKIIEKY